jgi:ribonuclease D
VFQDVNVLKICHSGALTRLWYFLCGSCSNSRNLLSLCKFELNVTAQYADWRKRPLHETLTKETGDEIHLLMKCWYKLIEQFGDCLMLFEFQKSRDACLKLYLPKRSKSHDDLFQVNMAKLSSSLKSVFNIESQRMHFAKIYEWREEQCKLIDKPRSDFLPKGRMGFISRAQPLTRNSLVSLFTDANAWKMTQVNSLIDCTRSAKHEKEMEVEDRPIEVVLSTRDSIPEEHHSSVLSSSDVVLEKSVPQVSRSQ